MKLERVKSHHGIHFLAARKVFYKDDNWTVVAYSGPHGYVDYGAKEELLYHI